MQLRAAVHAGALPPGLRLPGERNLAAELGVARGVVTEAYRLLAEWGVVEAAPGRGTRVTAAGGVPQANVTSRFLDDYTGVGPDPATPRLLSFLPGRTTTLPLDRRAWRQAWAEAARRPVPVEPPDPAGERELRLALAAYLSRVRGLVWPADHLIVTAGSLQAFQLILSSVPRPDDAVLMERVGYPLVHQAVQASRLRLIPAPVDTDGLLVSEALPGARLVYVTPSHQFPLGGRMSLERRHALLAWAQRHDALIVEDDYDGEVWHNVQPLPSLAQLDTEGRVLYLGTLSKVLTPSLRTGYLLAPPRWTDALVQARARLDSGHPVMVQWALTHLLTSGALDRHVARQRRWQQDVRGALLDSLNPLRAYSTLEGMQAGMHVCLTLHPPLDAALVAQRLLSHGVALSTLERMTLEGPVPNALLLAYGGLTAQQAREAAGRLVAVCQELLVRS
ncbi:PLP-dependent aminotransferase family protein [Deinococcus hohokamensis]|uniref:PLP-dependent aminotransferase family protein n=1 Tax=Deinococcus hohokamensis TaxID=309883 RepID=A0ABV9I635_9DEIO